MIITNRKKYGNVHVTVDGIRFDSGREADYYSQLKLEKRAGLIKSFELQVTFPLYAWTPSKSFNNASGAQDVKWVRVCKHRVDFLAAMPDGTQEVREVKGMATRLWALKKKLFCANYPEIAYKTIK